MVLVKGMPMVCDVVDRFGRQPFIFEYILIVGDRALDYIIFFNVIEGLWHAEAYNAKGGSNHWKLGPARPNKLCLR
jgi:hypothetical protein